MINNINTNPSTLWANVNRQTNSRPQATNFDPMQGINAPIVLKGDALYSAATRLPGGGMMNAHVFKADSFTAENPVMLVKGTDVDGSFFEVEVNINDIDKNSLSFIEMFALDGYFRANGQTCGLSRAASTAMWQSQIEANAFTKLDVLPSLREHLETQRSHGNWEAFRLLDEIIDGFMNHFARR